MKRFLHKKLIKFKLTDKWIMPLWAKTALRVAALLAIIITIVYVGYKNLIEIKQLKAEQERIISINNALKIENERLSRELYRLQNEKAALEEFAREEMGLIEEDEVVIKLK